MHTKILKTLIFKYTNIIAVVYVKLTFKLNIYNFQALYPKYKP